MSSAMWITVFLILSVAGLLHSLPAPATTLEYELGVSYKYSYQFAILLNEDTNITSRSASIGRNVGYKVSTDFLLSNVWENSADPREKLIKIELYKPSLLVSSTMHSSDGINRHWSKLDNLSYPPIYIHFNNGIVQKLYTLPDVESLTNIKKGLASLFQIKIADKLVQELDVSGLCDVQYKAHLTVIKKTKSNCKPSKGRKNQFGASRLREPVITSSSEMLINLLPQESIIKSLTGSGEVMMTLNLWKQAAVFVKTKWQLDLFEQRKNHPTLNAADVRGAVDLISKDIRTKLKEESLEVSVSTEKCVGNCNSIYSVIKENAQHFLPENLGTVPSASAFLKLHEGFRRASKKELLMLFKDADERILTQLLDVLAAAQTDDALDVAFQLIDFESEDITIAERFMLCLATLPYPRSAVITKTLKLMNRKIKSEKLRTTILVSLSSLVRTYCKNNPKMANSLVVEGVNDLILRELQDCRELNCVVHHLLALKNAASPTYVPTLLEYIKKGGIPGLVALGALKEIGEQYFTNEVKDTLHKAYSQFWPHQESAARVMAAELLMKNNPSVETIGYLIRSLSNRDQPEISTLVLSKLNDLALKNSALRNCVKEVLRNTTFGNYDNLAQNGSSTAYTKLLQASHDANLTYGINMEMRPTGMLKRTSIDLNLLGDNQDMHLLSLSLFVEGFGLNEEELKENPEEQSAGMELSVLGVHLRPYIFFSGSGELMGLVFSSAGSEPTTAVQANFLLMDHLHSVVLQNGISVDMNLKAALSTDVSGTVEVSMWNKNAHAVVRNSGSLLITGFCQVDTSFVESHVDFALGGNSNLEMTVDLDFSVKPMKICLQVEQPDYVFRHNVRKTETIPGSKHLIKTVKKRSIHFPGKSFNLHHKNSESCKELLFPKPSSSFW